MLLAAGLAGPISSKERYVEPAFLEHGDRPLDRLADLLVSKRIASSAE
jgi:hypothetical protein